MSQEEAGPSVFGFGGVVRAATVVILLANLLALAIGVAPNLSTRLVQLGEGFWPGYGNELRNDPIEPDCDAAELERRSATCVSAAPAPSGDPFGGKDPFGGPAPAPSDPFAGKDPFAAPAPAPAPAPPSDPFGGKDPFAAPAPAPAPAPAGGDPFAGKDPFAAPAPAPSDPFAGGDPFAPAPAPSVSCDALRNLHQQCVEQHRVYGETLARITPSVQRYRAFEGLVADVAHFGFWKHTLVLVVLLGAASASSARMHVALRTPESRVEHVAAEVSQIATHLLWMASCLADWQVQRMSTAEVEDPALPPMFAAGFLVLAAMHIVHLLHPRPGLDGKPSITRVLMCVPLYAWMTLISGVWFLGVEHHWSGQAIYLHKFIAYPNIYLGIGLYVWAGMLLSETRLAQLAFDVITPWRVAPNILGWLVAVISAVPTAYSGASGIFVIATGKTVYGRLVDAGANRRMALGATAMSGSLGVVLRPCLVVVLIAVLNSQVTTDGLFGYGMMVFALTSTLYLLASLLASGQSEPRAPETSTTPASQRSLAAVTQLVPFLLIAVGVVLAYRVIFAIHVNEHTAQLVLPVGMLLLVAWDRLLRPGLAARTIATPLSHASRETSHHAGALLMVMAGSVGFGGVVERSEVMSLVPQDLGSPFLAMSLLVFVMVLVGMLMDALGAVILVSVTLAPLAYDNGIQPVHFWMMTLVAFELGYLTPPV
ncbi:MAG: TRAP transporter large permease subunit, partial [Myxococcales bacterium]|nr:TRAP transporter large permease subunit [Myxococcales bacterium]